jgi:hypothetical protein
MTLIAELIDRAITAPDDAALERVRDDVLDLAAGFPLYPSRRVRQGQRT